MYTKRHLRLPHSPSPTSSSPSYSCTFAIPANGSSLPNVSRKESSQTNLLHPCTESIRLPPPLSFLLVCLIWRFSHGQGNCKTPYQTHRRFSHGSEQQLGFRWKGVWLK